MSAGRPHGFDRRRTLDRALELFWRNGYEGTSVADLTEAMDVSRPSLHAAFGDKEQLFRAAVAHYAAEHASHVGRALEQQTAAGAIRTLLTDAAAALTAPERPAGCLLVHGAPATGDEGAVARDLLLAERLGRQAAIRARLARAADDGDLPAGADPVVMAEYVMAVLNGMAVQALGGANRGALVAIAELALRALGLDGSGADQPKKRGGRSTRARVSGSKPDGLPGQLAMDL